MPSNYHESSYNEHGVVREGPVPGYVLVRVAINMLGVLDEWSPPVQGKIVETPGRGTGWDLIFRTMQTPTDQPLPPEVEVIFEDDF